MLIGLVAVAAPAEAAFPGADGEIRSNVKWSADGAKIAYIDYVDASWVCTHTDEVWQRDIVVVNADGTGWRNVTDGCNQDEGFAWSPDGTKLVITGNDFYYQQYSYVCIVRLSDGQSSPCRYDSFPNVYQSPAWSPDGSTILLSGISAWNSDLSGFGFGTPLGAGTNPDWSPDSSKIVFQSNRDGNWEIYVMNRDGSGQTRLTNNSSSDDGPIWSPDGNKILFRTNRDGNYERYLMNPDGTGQHRMTNSTIDEPFADWQALDPVRPYAYPIGTALSRWSLAPTFVPCDYFAQNGSHGSALAALSCNPPAPTSSLVAVGPRSLGFAQTRTLASGECAPFDSTHCHPDFTLIFNVTDVRSGSATGPDYDATNWDLTGTASIQITDKNNQYFADPSGPYDKAATGTPLSIPVPIDCVPTTDTTVGSTCAIKTTANTLLPGAAVAGKRAVLQLGQVQLLDRGANGTPGDTDDQVFEAQGVFIP